jgi:peptidyl-prolyl cis-trans isomerase A (cyclophilin A)
MAGSSRPVNQASPEGFQDLPMSRLLLSALLVAAPSLYGCSTTDRGAVAQADQSTGKKPTQAAPAEAVQLTGDEQPQGNADANGVFYVKLETSQGDVYIEVHPEWAPNGAAHFKELVEAKFYDECRFFRVIEGFMAQVGMNGNPEVQAEWGEKNIKDDKVVRSNTRGFVTYAQTGAPNSRSTQFFINYRDNSFLDADRFAPFGIVIEGMGVIDSLYKDYGEGAPSGRGPSQGLIAQRGNEYLQQRFPKLDYIKTATIVAKADVPSLKDK